MVSLRWHLSLGVKNKKNLSCYVEEWGMRISQGSNMHKGPEVGERLERLSHWKASGTGEQRVRSKGGLEKVGATGRATPQITNWRTGDSSGLFFQHFYQWFRICFYQSLEIYCPLEMSIQKWVLEETSIWLTKLVSKKV